MKYRLATAFVLLVALFLFSIAVAAQHPQHHPAQTTPKAESKGDTSGVMMAQHQEMEKPIDYLLHSLAAMEVERDPAAMSSKLVNHRSLLEELQSKVNQCSEMTAHLDEQRKICTMMRSEKKQD
jgi:hypothetical protein